MSKSNHFTAPLSGGLPSSSELGAPTRDSALDLTRLCLTLLVIAHHAVLAYHLYAPPAGAFTRENMVWGAFPVVDAARAPGLDTFTLWNDSYFMAMMFLLSGLFVWPSIQRKGVLNFLRDRALRLGLPFVVAAAVLAPLAYWPAYLQRAEATGNPGFWNAWTSLGIWPAGPAWFLWVLLAFSGVAAGLQAWLPPASNALARFGTWARTHPVKTSAVFCALVVPVYFATTRVVSPFVWATWGPFTVQTSRLPLYAIYFFVGCALGSGGMEKLRDWMRAEGSLARCWKWAMAAAGMMFGGFVATLIMWFSQAGKGGASLSLDIAANAMYAITGVATTFALLALFARKGHRSHAMLASLARNAFGMYLVHYAIVTWLQYALLTSAWAGGVKASVVMIGAVALSWGVAAALRKLPGVREIL
ncbi:acyltransferase family protein [Oleiharenicola lentus]|uniref:acyltransferase family protein n=1 Tax=Oleiharenicola lentus TaxID=2508720 RepID=UPI003F6785F3